MSMRHNEDRELEIKIAELQAEFQFYLTAGFGMLAVFIAVMIGLEQIFFALSPGDPMRTLIVVMVCVIGPTCWYFTMFFLKKAGEERKKIGELRKEFVW
jgi:hypothetical protein